jgi:hypothetical protein
MKTAPGEFDQDIDHALSMADELRSEGKADEAIVELLGALLIEVRSLRLEWRRQQDA